MVKGPLQRREPSKLRNLIKIAEWLGFWIVVLHFLCSVLMCFAFQSNVP